MTPPISAIIPVKNEARNIRRCLASVAWVDEVVVVDNFSTDDTAALAEEFPNVKVVQTEFLGYAGNKIFGLEAAGHDWILWLDADEELPPPLRAEIEAAVGAGECDALDMPRKTYFMNEWVRSCGWYPGRVIRVFRRDKAVFNEKLLHEGVDLLPGARLGHLREDLLHHSYVSLAQYFGKMNGYGKLGAEELRRKGRRFSWFALIGRTHWTFIKSWLLQGGIREGARGFIISMGGAYSTFIRWVNLYYLERRGTVDLENDPSAE